MLEGGYDLPALASSAAAHCGVLFGGYSALSKHSAEAESEEKHAVATAANQGLRSSADGDGEGDSEKSYGGDEAAALAAHIASLDLGPSIRRP